MTRRRLDTELVRRGLAASRSEAREAVSAGLVTIAGQTATKVATMVADDQPVDIRGRARRFVSRGGDKLRAGLDRFSVDPSGLDCLDAGASTGGFTDCLLQAGARHVVAVDVGYGQLAWELRTDPRVNVMERTNVRSLAADALPFRPALIAADLSFISLRLVLPALGRLCSDDASFVLLVKPQFEAGPSEVSRGGVVRSAETWRRVLEEIARACVGEDLSPQAVMASPVVGPAGNVEFLLLARKGQAGGGMASSFDLEGAIREGIEVAG